MTENPQQPTESEKKAMAKEWFDEAEAALERTGESLRAAWDASRGSRMSALEAAKEAASQLGAAIDRGVSGAKQRWEASKGAETATPDEEE